MPVSLSKLEGPAGLTGIARASANLNLNLNLKNAHHGFDEKALDRIDDYRDFLPKWEPY